MKSILITGIIGFVGGHFTQFLLDKRPDYAKYGVSRSRPSWDFIQITFYEYDLLDSTKINALIAEIRPDYILHVASFRSVAQSWRDPITSFLNNTNVFLNLVEAVRFEELKTKILSIGSSEKNDIIKDIDLPLMEKNQITPANPYAVARVSDEYIAHIYVKGYKNRGGINYPGFH